MKSVWRLLMAASCALASLSSFATTTHDAVGLLSPAPEITKDEFNRITSVTSATGERTTYEYFEDDDRALMKAATFPDGTRAEYTRSAALFAHAVLLPFTQPLALKPDAQTCETGNRVGFGGYFYSCSTGLYFTPSGRWYDPEFARFQQQDSYVGKVEDPPSLHRYLFAHDNPTRYIDPSGHSDADANALAAEMSKRVGVLASDHRPAYERGYYYNIAHEFAYDFPRRVLSAPMNMFEGLARTGIHDANGKVLDERGPRQLAEGAAETVVTAAAGVAIPRAVNALVERVPVLGRSVRDVASEMLESAKKLMRPVPAPNMVPGPPGIVPIQDAAMAPGGFSVTETGAELWHKSPASNPVGAPNGGATYTDETISIALGKTEAGGTPLAEFAEGKGAYWEQFHDAGLVDSTTELRSGFDRAFVEKVLPRSGDIHFNLEGVDVARTMGATPPKAVSPYLTEWELRTIADNPEWLARSRFYVGDKLLSSDEVYGMGIRPSQAALKRFLQGH